MEASPAQLREESFRGPTSLKTASVIVVMPMESVLILRRQVGKHRKKLLKFDRTICTTTWHHVLTKVALEATTVRSTKSILTSRRSGLASHCQGLIIVWSWSAARMMKMLVTRILMPLDLNLSKARGVGLFHSGLPTTDLQKMNNYYLPKCKKKLYY